MSKKPVIIIEDEKYIIELYETYFNMEKVDHLIELYQGGVSLPESIFDDRHLVVTDLMMPEEDGWSVIEKAKKLCPNAEVWVFSGNIDESIAAKLKEKGVHKIIYKPYSPVEFAQDITTYIEQEKL